MPAALDWDTRQPIPTRRVKGLISSFCQETQKIISRAAEPNIVLPWKNDQEKPTHLIDFIEFFLLLTESFEAKWNSSIYYWNKNEIFHSSKQLIFFFLEFSIVTFRNLWCCTLKFSLMRAFSCHRLAINLRLSAFLFTGNKLYLPTPFSNSVTLVKNDIKSMKKRFKFWIYIIPSCTAQVFSLWKWWIILGLPQNRTRNFQGRFSESLPNYIISVFS